MARQGRRRVPVARTVDPEAKNRAVAGRRPSGELIAPTMVERSPRRPEHLIAIPSELLLQAAHSARSFQRSALGYHDHPGWLERVRADAENLVDVLTAMGFLAQVSGSVGATDAT